MDEPNSSDPAAHLRDGLRAVGWEPSDLWIASVALGSHLALGEVTDIMLRLRTPTRGEYDVIALALNERFMDLGRDHPMTYWDDLPRREMSAEARDDGHQL